MHPYSERRRSRPKDVEASSSTAASSGTAAPPTTSAIASPQLYPKPSQTWLTWAANPEFGDGYYLRCLMCGKWVSDWDSIDTGSYVGLHGGPGPDNQKEHAKKLASLHEFGLWELERTYVRTSSSMYQQYGTCVRTYVRA